MRTYSDVRDELAEVGDQLRAMRATRAMTGKIVCRIERARATVEDLRAELSSMFLPSAADLIVRELTGIQEGAASAKQIFVWRYGHGRLKRVIPVG